MRGATLTTLSVVIAHKPGRVARVHEMRLVLGDSIVESTPGSPHVWSMAQWTEGLRQHRGHCIFLDDDLILPADFRAQALAAVRLRPTEIISFTQHMPEAKEADAKDHQWVTSEGLITGQAYAMPHKVLSDFLLWRETCLLPLEQDVKEPDFISCDGLINLYALCMRRKIWHTVPALVTHDLSLPSNFGNEGDWGRSCTVPWRETRNHNDDYVHSPRAQSNAIIGMLKHVKPECWDRFDCLKRYYAMAGALP